jgi:hypothetical protein
MKDAMRNKDFRLSKTSKRMLAMFVNPQKGSDWKNMMIDAEIAERKARMAKIRDKSNTNQGDE